MQHVRIVTPGGLAPEILEALKDDTATTNLIHQRGISLDPPGDVIEVDVAREGLNDLVERLRETGIHRVGTVQIQPVATWVSRAGLEAEKRTPGSSADAVVWADVTQRAYDESELNWTYLTFMTLATLIASIAIIVDSQVLVIGAMVLGPEFIAIAALGLALVRRRYDLLRFATRSLVVGFGVAIGIVTLLALLARWIGWISVDQVTAPRPLTAFIYSPDKWSLVVAVVAAAAGVLSLTSAKVGGLSGVFISVTTVPAAGNVALCLAFGIGHELWGSVAQLVINVAGMAVAGWATLAFQQSVWGRVSARRAALRQRWSRRHSEA
ncbi:DUF389 domain-containing protein [Nocardioides sp.]|uniref:DUF389 domain-containing protein n=1 Tax=Nocardioides sp. TaxID=35761 RepID=UPI00260A7A87|nr:DUF389 domain-containing protein [Nocardioides sp.]